jgi:NitT/TauT family transport system substrate-binding protein
MDTVYTHDLLRTDRADFTVTSAPELLPSIEDGEPLVALAGLHGGCYELFGNERVRRVADLKGKRIAVGRLGRQATEHFYLSSMLAYIGIDPRKDVDWVDGHTFDGTMDLFVAGKADAFLGFPPQPQQLRARKIGRVIVNTAQDKPWSEYYCCLVSARREFVRRYPVATKRALRAILKASDICAAEPERAARYLVLRGYESQYEVASEVVRSLSYARWRTFNVEDSLRFFGVRLHELGMIKTEPNKLIARGIDFRFVEQLKQELKA